MRTEIEIIKDWELVQYRAKEIGAEIYANDGLYTLRYGNTVQQFETIDGVHGYFNGFDDGVECAESKEKKDEVEEELAETKVSEPNKVVNKALEDYYNSREFSLKTSIILGQKKISGMSLEAGSQEVKGLTFAEFNYYCDAIYHNLKDRVEEDFDDQGYTFYNLEYRGYKFRYLPSGVQRLYNCERKR